MLATPNPKLQTPNPKSQILDPKSSIPQGLVAGNVVVAVGELIKMVMHRQLCSNIKLRHAKIAPEPTK